MVEMKKVYEKEEMGNVKENIKELFYCLDAVALGGALHIVRGKMEPDDPLRKHMITWLGALQLDLAKKIN